MSSPIGSDPIGVDEGEKATPTVREAAQRYVALAERGVHAAHAAYDLLRLALSSDLGDWRDIRTAPIDGRRVLLYFPCWTCGDPVRLGAYDFTLGWWRTTSGPCTADERPTMWQKVPAPPLNSADALSYHDDVKAEGVAAVQARAGEIRPARDWRVVDDGSEAIQELLCSPPMVERVETVTPESGYQEAGSPYWRVTVGPEARCIDFDDEHQARLLARAVGEHVTAAVASLRRKAGGENEDARLVHLRALFQKTRTQGHVDLYPSRPSMEKYKADLTRGDDVRTIMCEWFTARFTYDEDAVFAQAAWNFVVDVLAERSLSVSTQSGEE